MSKFDRDLAALRQLAEEKRSRGKRREDYPEGIERDSFVMSEFFRVRCEDPMFDEEGPPPSYEECLAWSIRYHSSPSYRAKQRAQSNPPMLWDLQKAEERLGYRPTSYEYYLEIELGEQPEYDRELEAMSFDPYEWLKAYERRH
jgi:hypothetical protein